MNRMDENKVREAIIKIRTATNATKEMIKHNKLFFPEYDNSRLKEDIEFFHIEIEALEKQLSKKPNKVKDSYTPKIGEFRVGICPNCLAEVSDRFDVCLDCGQKLDWTENKSERNPF